TVSDINGIVVPDPNRVARSPGNSTLTMFQAPDTFSVLGKRITGDVYFGSDDDYLGLAFGLNSGDPFTQALNSSTPADYLLLQWKGADQNFDFADVGQFAGTFHDNTPGGFAPAGVSLSRVTGTGTADEFWQRTDLEYPAAPNDLGGLAELARGSTFGSAGYDRNGGRHQFAIEITPTGDNVKIWIDGSLEFDVNAPVGNNFTDGTFGVMEGWQSGGFDEAFAYWNIRDIGTGSDPVTPDLTIIFEPLPFAAANFNFYPDASSDIPSGTASGELQIVSGPNTGDIEFNIDGEEIYEQQGALINITRERGKRWNLGQDSNGNTFLDPSTAQFGNVESPSPSGFGNSAGTATGGRVKGSEYNTSGSAAFFNYESFDAGYVSSSGVLNASNDDGKYTTAEPSIAQPPIYENPLVDKGNVDENNNPILEPRQGLHLNVFTLNIDSFDGNTDGLLFTASDANEDNYVSAVPQADGSFVVGVKDVNSVPFGADDTFENNNGFAFVD
ncbi:MAG: hypothetical protein MI741_15900, partial [Rhodospirillales bacterium]|nr:hypothetical protein [Rhodospirillales bacterium]